MSNNTLPAETGAKTPASVIAGIIGISVVAAIFLTWLVYFHPPVDAAGTHLAFLPALDAVLNALCAVFLLVGFRYIRQREILKHRNSMFGAFVVSSAFLVAYIMNHVLHGDMLFPRDHPTARFVYLWVLLTPHILLAILLPADDPDYVLPVAHGAFSGAPSPRALDVPHLALRFS